MSYGYLIVSANSPWLIKDRYHKFELTDEIEDLFFYSRLDETQTFTTKKDNYFHLTPLSIEFLNKVKKPVFFMHFLLKNRQCEYDIALLAREIIIKKRFELLESSDKNLELNQLYKIEFIDV